MEYVSGGTLRPTMSDGGFEDEDKNKRFASVVQLRSALERAIGIIQTVQPMTGDLRFGTSLASFGGDRLGIVSVTAMAIWHLMGEPGKVAIPSEPVPGIKQPVTKAGQQKTDTDGATATLSPPELFLGRDGIRMRLISGRGLPLRAELAAIELICPELYSATVIFYTSALAPCLAELKRPDHLSRVYQSNRGG